MNRNKIIVSFVLLIALSLCIVACKDVALSGTYYLYDLLSGKLDTSIYWRFDDGRAEYHYGDGVKVGEYKTDGNEVTVSLDGVEVKLTVTDDCIKSDDAEFRKTQPEVSNDPQFYCTYYVFDEESGFDEQRYVTLNDGTVTLKLSDEILVGTYVIESDRLNGDKLTMTFGELEMTGTLASERLLLGDEVLYIKGSEPQQHVHNLISEVIDATCVTDGKIIYKCSDCGYVDREEVIPATGHTFDENSTCLKCGQKVVYTVLVGYDSSFGVIQLDPDKNTFLHGEKVVVTVKCIESYFVNSFKVGDDDLTSELLDNPCEDGYEYTLVVTQNVRITATFGNNEINSYTLDLLASDVRCGSVAISPQKDRYYEGDVVTVTVDNNRGYDIQRFEVGGKDLLTELLLGDCTFSFTVGEELCKQDRKISIVCFFLAVDYAKVHDLDYINFDNVIKHDLVIVDFYTSWCTNCPPVANAFKKLATMNTGARICRINADNRKESGTIERTNYDKIMARFGLVGWPNVGLFKDGKLVASRTGGGTVDSLVTAYRNMIRNYSD